MKIINTSTNKEITPLPGVTLYAKQGKVKGQKYILGEIVSPCDKYPDGFLKTKIVDGGYQGFYPFVFDLKISS